MEWPAGVSWKEYVDIRFAAVDVAVDKAEKTMEHRLNASNGLLELVKENQKEFATCKDMDVVNENLKRLNTYMDTQTGKASQQSVNIAMVLAVIGVAGMVISIVLQVMGV